MQDSANEAARKITSNADLNATWQLMGFKNLSHEIEQYTIAQSYIFASSINAATEQIVAGQYMIVDCIDDLRALFDTRSAEIIWQIEQQRKEFKEINERLYKAVIETDKNRAKQKKEKGIAAYNNGWFDEAIRDFNESIDAYNYDFVVYQFLGNIYLFEKRDPITAIDHYKLALKYAEPYNRYYAGLASLHIGLSHYDMGNFQGAYIAASKAIQLNRDLIEAYYRCAQYCSKLGRYDEAINNLKISINADRGYWLRVFKEIDDFRPMSDKLRYLMEYLTREEQNKANEEIEKSSQLIKKFSKIGIPSEVKKKLDEAISLQNSGMYLDFRDAKYKAKSSQLALLDFIISKLSIEKPNLEEQLNDLTEILNKNRPKLQEFKTATMITFPMAILGGGVIYSIIYNEEPPFLGPILGSILDNGAEGFLNGILFLFVFIICPFAVPLFILYLVKYVTLPQAPSLEKIRSIEKKLANTSQNLENAKEEKRRLNIGEHAENIDYEKHLRKTYG